MLRYFNHVIAIVLAGASSAYVFAAGDIEITPAAGKALVIKDSTGAHVRFQVNESGEIIIPALPKTGAGQALCRDEATGEIIGCSGGGAGGGFVIKSGGVVLGSALDASQFITDEGYYSYLSAEGNIDTIGNSIHYESLDCTGQAYLDFEDDGKPGYVFGWRGLFWAIPTDATPVAITANSSGKPGSCAGSTFSGQAKPVVQNNPAVTGIQNKGTPYDASDRYPWPITIEPK